MTALLKHIELKWLLVVSLLSLGTLLCIQNLDFYLVFDFKLMLILLVSPFVIFVKYPGEYSIRYAVLSLLFLGLYPVLKIQSCFFVGFSFFLLFVIESWLGKLNNLPLFFVVVVSPFALFLFNLFGFPIRLQLTHLATEVLVYIYPTISNAGNMILFEGNEFSVDPECMGIKMTVTGFLIALGMIAYVERSTDKNLNFFWIAGLMLATGFFIVSTNFLRIVTIILFKAMPGTMAHEFIGILSLVVYTVVPLYFLVKTAFRYLGQEKRESKPVKQKSWITWSLTGILLASLCTLNLYRDDFRNTGNDSKLSGIHLPAYKDTLLENGVLQLENEHALVYIKPGGSFYGPDHTPTICWRGSGYTFVKENKIEVNQKQLFTAELRSEEDTLHTAWWYDNGSHQTINQFDWRWRTLKGEEPFRIINVTVSDKEELECEVGKLMEAELF